MSPLQDPRADQARVGRQQPLLRPGAEVNDIAALNFTLADLPCADHAYNDLGEPDSCCSTRTV